MISLTGLIVPSEFETWVTATILRPRGEQLRVLVEEELPAIVHRNHAQLAPCASQAICQGTMFEWCSIAEITTSSPADRCVRPQSSRPPG